jgi:hypothetical protein
MKHNDDTNPFNSIHTVLDGKITKLSPEEVEFLFNYRLSDEQEKIKLKNLIKDNSENSK